MSSEAGFVSFAMYAGLVKNLRGVVYCCGCGWEEVAGWLERRFRYRNLGVPPSLRGRVCGGPFVDLWYPVESVGRVAGVLGGKLGDSALGEALVLASCYVSPLLVLGEGAGSLVERISVGVVRCSKEMGVNDWKLHLRIADYTILDMYRDCVVEALRVLRGEAGVEDVLEARRERVERDVKRYWRIAGGEGWVFLGYVDLLALLRGDLDALREVGLDSAACLAVVPAVCIEPARIPR